MKNIHVLTTEKFSNLILQTNGELRLSELELRRQVGNGFTQHIYITSNEEIKRGDWCITAKGNLLQMIEGDTVLGFALLGCKKIILTDNKDLIKDGVQAINDEFIEWFVKNPNCEEVEIKSWIKTYEDGSSFDRIDYEIIIPKEEPKPNLFCETPEEKCTMNYCDENGCQNRKRELVEPKPKQETLEDFIIENGERIAQLIIAKHERAEWKLQQVYSEEKIDKILQKLEEIKIMINAR